MAAGSGSGGQAAWACVVALGLALVSGRCLAARVGGGHRCLGGCGLPWARHNVGGLVRVLVSGPLLWAPLMCPQVPTGVGTCGGALPLFGGSFGVTLSLLSLFP